MTKIFYLILTMSTCFGFSAFSQSSIRSIEVFKVAQNSSKDTVEHFLYLFAKDGLDSISYEYNSKKIIAKTFYQFDSQNRLITESEFLYDQEDDTLYDYHYFYNKDGFLNLKIESSNNTIDFFNERLMINNDTVIEKIRTVVKNKIIDRNDTLVIDKAGKTLQKLSGKNIQNYVYDSNGEWLKIEFIGKDYKHLWNYVYTKYDSNNNWVERKQYLKNELKYTSTRIINYCK